VTSDAAPRAPTFAAPQAPLPFTIVVEGNDGTGKSTLVAGLRALGWEARDRGFLTKATDEGLPATRPADEVLLVLDLPEAESRARLAKAGKDLEEQYHTLASLVHYRARYRALAAELGLELLDASGPPDVVLARALARLGLPAEPLRLGVPKGRLLESTGRALTDAGLPLVFAGPRDLHPGCQGLRPFVLKPRSIPAMVAHGLLDLGLCGRDLVHEADVADRLAVVVDLGTHRVRVVVAAADPRLVASPPPRPLVIATEYPLLADRWASGRGLAHLCVNTWGSTEAWVPHHADACVDVVETGSTLAANGLVELETLLESTTVLVARADEPGVRFHRLVHALARSRP
jgi:ATP phosphoribosyltransferase